MLSEAEHPRRGLFEHGNTLRARSVAWAERPVAWAERPLARHKHEHSFDNPFHMCPAAPALPQQVLHESPSFADVLHAAGSPFGFFSHAVSPAPSDSASTKAVK